MIRLFGRRRKRGGNHRKHGWGQPMASDDASMYFEGSCPHENENEREACVSAMRDDLNRWRRHR
jgi:hypothetical protein